jgi:LysM repeat protein
MQVIGSEAQGNDEMLRDLSKQVMARAATATAEPQTVTPVAQSGQTALAAGLGQGIDPFATPTDEAGDEHSEQKLEAFEATAESTPDATKTPTPTPEVGEAGATLTPERAANSACPPLSAGAPYCLYTVQDGDTLSTIAERLGITSTPAFSAAELVALSNGLNDAQNWVIVPGQELRIPVESGVIHTVSASETLSTLAQEYGVSATEIIAANNFADPNNVPVGEQIIIPSPSLWPWSGPSTAAVSEDGSDDETADDAPDDETTLAETEPTEAPTDTPEADTPTSEPTATEMPATETPEPTETIAVASKKTSANPSLGSTRDDFAAGYIAGGGPPQYLEQLLSNVIPCESGFNLRAFNPAGPFYGLMQFLPETWARTGGGDWFDAWQQGHNTGVLLQSSSPATQWPACW